MQILFVRRFIIKFETDHKISFLKMLLERIDKLTVKKFEHLFMVKLHFLPINPVSHKIMVVKTLSHIAKGYCTTDAAFQLEKEKITDLEHTGYPLRC